MATTLTTTDILVTGVVATLAAVGGILFVYGLIRTILPAGRRARCCTSPEPKTAPLDIARLPAWDEVAEGAPKDVVRDLLGEPDEIEALFPPSGVEACRWKYDRYGPAAGVTFREGRVAGIRKPT